MRTRLQGKGESQGRKRLLFYNRYLLLRKAESLSYKEQLKLGHCYPELAIAWSLKESLRGWYESLRGFHAY